MPQADQMLHSETKEFLVSPAPQFDAGRTGPAPAGIDDHQINPRKFARGQFESGLRDNKHRLVRPSRFHQPSDRPHSENKVPQPISLVDPESPTRVPTRPWPPLQKPAADDRGTQIG